MNITRVSISTDLCQDEDGRLLGFGSIDLDNCLRIEHIRIAKTIDGRVVVWMPSVINRFGQRKDMVHPLTQELRGIINECVLEEIRKRRPGDYG